eukprot:jgi/Bigna1/134206/aug1.24_g8914
MPMGLTLPETGKVEVMDPSEDEDRIVEDGYEEDSKGEQKHDAGILDFKSSSQANPSTFKTSRPPTQLMKTEQAMNATVDEYLRSRNLESAHNALFKVCGLSGGMGLSRMGILKLARISSNTSNTHARFILREAESNPKRSILEIIFDSISRDEALAAVNDDGIGSGFDPRATRSALEQAYPSVRGARVREEIEAEVAKRVAARLAIAVDKEKDQAIARERARAKAEMDTYRTELEGIYQQKLLTEKRRSEAVETRWKERVGILQSALDQQKQITLQAARQLKGISKASEEKKKALADSMQKERDKVTAAQKDANARLLQLENVYAEAELEVSRAKNAAEDAVRSEFGQKHRKLQQELEDCRQKLREKAEQYSALADRHASHKERLAAAEANNYDAKRRAMRAEMAAEEYRMQVQSLQSSERRRLEEVADVQRQLGRLKALAEAKESEAALSREQQRLSEATLAERMKLASAEGGRRTAEELERVKLKAARMITQDRLKHRNAKHKWAAAMKAMEARLRWAYKVAGVNASTASAAMATNFEPQRQHLQSTIRRLKASLKKHSKPQFHMIPSSSNAGRRVATTRKLPPSPVTESEFKDAERGPSANESEIKASPSSDTAGSTEPAVTAKPKEREHSSQNQHDVGDDKKSYGMERSTSPLPDGSGPLPPTTTQKQVYGGNALPASQEESRGEEPTRERMKGTAGDPPDSNGRSESENSAESKHGADKRLGSQTAVLQPAKADREMKTGAKRSSSAIVRLDQTHSSSNSSGVGVQGEARSSKMKIGGGGNDRSDTPQAHTPEISQQDTQSQEENASQGMGDMDIMSEPGDDGEDWAIASNSHSQLPEKHPKISSGSDVGSGDEEGGDGERKDGGETNRKLQEERETRQRALAGDLGAGGGGGLLSRLYAKNAKKKEKKVQSQAQSEDPANSTAPGTTANDDDGAVIDDAYDDDEYAGEDFEEEGYDDSGFGEIPRGKLR